MTEDDHSALLGREHLDEFAHVAAGLLAHDALLYVVVVEFQRVHYVTVGTVGDKGHLVVTPEIVDNQVVGYAHDPMDEFIFILVVAIIESGDDLKEGILEDIVCHIFVFHYGENVAVDFCLIS